METYNPYNSHNRSFRAKDVECILHRHGLPHYRVQYPKLFQTAMVHTTYVKRQEYTTPDGRPAALAACPAGVMPLQDESYECMEFEGDSVLGVCTATKLRRKYPEKKQGFLTDARKELVNNERLGALSKLIGLNRFYVISRHNEESAAIDGRNNNKKLGDIFEAFLGALWVDCGYRFDVVYTFVNTVFDTYLDIDDVVNTVTNWKEVFQKVCQRELKCTPEYDMISNDPKKGEIEVVCRAGDRIMTHGIGSTRKKAEQVAAAAALKLMTAASGSPSAYPSDS